MLELRSLLTSVGTPISLMSATKPKRPWASSGATSRSPMRNWERQHTRHAQNKTCAGVCQPSMGSFHSQQHQGTGKGSEAGSKISETRLQTISMCRHYAKTTALARAAEKASVPQCLLQIPPWSHPHQVKTLSITNWLPSENCLNLHDLTCGIPSHLDSLWAEDFLPRTISEPQQVITAPTAGSFETSVCSFPKSLMCINKKWVSEGWGCAG